MDTIITDSSVLEPSLQSIYYTSSYNLNFKTIFLFVILICACCMLSFGYNFEINNLFNLESISFWAFIMLTLFLFYVLYEFFKSDTCEDLNKSGWDRLKYSLGRGRRYMGQLGTNAMLGIGNRMATFNPNQNSNNLSTQFNKYGQSMLPEQYRNPVYTNVPTTIIETPIA